MRIPGRKAARQAYRWLHSRFDNRALILGYHRVSSDRIDPYGLCIQPEIFAQQMEVLCTHAHPTQLSTLAVGLRSGQFAHLSAAVTFDDGYADVVENAIPVLEKFGIPATIYIVAGSLERPFWWDQLAWIFENGQMPGGFRLQMKGRWFQASPGTQQRDLLAALARHLEPLDEANREEVLADICEQLHVTLPERMASSSMSAAQVQELARHPLIEIGSHSVGHRPLASSPMAAARQEIQDSKRILEELTGNPIHHFSYPNGSTNPEIQTAVRDAGYLTACSSVPNVTTPSISFYNLPRFWPQNQPADAFSRWLRRWL